VTENMDRTTWPWPYAPDGCEDWDVATWHAERHLSAMRGGYTLPQQDLDVWVARQRASRDLWPFDDDLSRVGYEELHAMLADELATYAPTQGGRIPDRLGRIWFELLDRRKAIDTRQASLTLGGLIEYVADAEPHQVEAAGEFADSVIQEWARDGRSIDLADARQRLDTAARHVVEVSR
jgi:hypothetical protein